MIRAIQTFPEENVLSWEKIFPWIMREVNHWLCICANISHKGVGSCRSWIKLIRCQRFCNRVYVLGFCVGFVAARSFWAWFFSLLGSGVRKGSAALGFSHEYSEFRLEWGWFSPEVEEVIKTTEDWCMSARGWNSVNFSNPDRACGMKVLTKRKLPSGKKSHPFTSHRT